MAQTTDTSDAPPAECVLLADSDGVVRWASPPVDDVVGRSPEPDETAASLLGPAAPDPPAPGTAPVTTTMSHEGTELTVTVETLSDGDAVYRCRRATPSTFNPHRALDRITDAVVELDTDWRYTYVNDAAETLLERSADELLGEVVWEVFPEAEGTHVEWLFERAMATQDPLTTEWHWEPTGRDIEVRAFPSPTGLSVYFRDVTDRTAREEALRRERDLVEQLLSVSPMGIAVHTPDGRFVRLNDRAESVLGVEPDDLLGEVLDESDWDAYGPDGEPFPDEAFPFNVVRRTGEPTFGTEMSVQQPDGDPVWLSVSAAPLKNDAGDIERIVVTFEEITERKQYEAELRESEQQFRAVFDGTLDALILADDEGTYHAVNEAACELFGREESELVGHNVAEFAPEGFDVAAAWAAFIEQGTLRGEFPVVQPDGEVRTADFAATANVTPGRHLSALRDITERKAQREELERLADLNDLIRGVNRVVVGATDRETIEQAVCDTLVQSERYAAAITTRLTADGGMQVEYAAGLSDDLLARLRTEGAAFIEPSLYRTATERVPTVLDDLAENERYRDLLGSTASDCGVTRLQNVPLEHDGTVYGVLTVVSADEAAFDERERGVFVELGGILGGAIDAIQTKKLLHASSVLELELEIGPHNAPLVALTDRVGGSLTLRGVVPVETGQYLLYADLEGVDPEAVEGVDLAGVELLRVIETEPTVVVELRVGAGVAMGALLDSGGRIHAVTAADGVGKFTVDLTLDTDVRRFIDRVRELDVDVDLLAKREVDRTPTAVWSGTGEDTELTSRQRTVLEAAYRSGYFDWPRRQTTGEELADSLGIASSTLHQHLRVASAKVFEQYFSAV